MIKKMLSEKLQNQAHYLLTTNKFFIAADKGEIKYHHIQYYLNNVAHIVSYTTPCITQALKNTSDSILANFLRQKIDEEDGHDEWALDNLHSLGANREINKENISKNLELLLNYLIKLSKSAPKHYLLYMLTAEYLLILIGPTLAKNLIEKCGILPAQISVLTMHIDLDKEHTEEDFKICEHVFSDTTDLSEIDNTLTLFSKYIDGFYNDIITDCLKYDNMSKIELNA